MLTLYWVVVGLSGLLVAVNAKKAVRKFFTDHNAPYFVLYMGLLLILAYLLVSVTSHVIDIVKTAEEAELVIKIPHPPGRVGLQTQIPQIDD